MTLGKLEIYNESGSQASFDFGYILPGEKVESADIYLELANAINGRVTAAAGPVEQDGWSLAATPSNLNLNTLERHVFFWVKCFCLPAQNTRAKGGIGISISSDVTPTITGIIPWRGPTNSKSWFVTGKDFEPTSGWVCYVIDPTGTPDLSIGSPDMASVDRAGIRVDTLLIVGGGAVKPKPHIWDKIAYGTGLTINDGTSGSPVTIADIYAADFANANCFGVVTRVTGIYFVAGKLLFGTIGQTAVSYFKDINQVLVYQDFPVASTFYEIKLVGAASYPTTVQFGNYVSGLISGGCIIRGGGLTTRRAIAPVIVSGGTGYTVGDILNVVGGTYITQAQVKVITVSSGVITELRMETAGFYSVPPIGTLTLSGGTGSGATCTLTFVGGSIWTLTANAVNQTLNLYGCTLSEMKTAALASSSTLRGCLFDNFGNITTSGATIDGCTFQNMRTITPISATYALVMTVAGTVTNCKFINCAPAIFWNVNADTNTRLDGSTFISGGTGHGMELGSNTPSAITIDDVTWTGYGAGGTTDAAIYNNSEKAITITITGTGNTPTVRNGTGASTTVISGAVNATVTVKNSATPPAAIENANVLVLATSGGPMPVDVTVTITRLDSTATVTHTAHGMATNDKVLIKGANQPEYNGVYIIIKIDDNSYSYTVSGTPETPATGTIKATYAALFGLTNSSGVITMSRVFSSNQPISGRVRKATGSPLYKTSDFIGTISSTGGFSTTIQMIVDE